jgi:hypothetical protein
LLHKARRSENDDEALLPPDAPILLPSRERIDTALSRSRSP